MANKLDLRQSEYRGTLDQIGNQTNPEGDNLLRALNAQVTPLLRMSAQSTPSLVVSVGGGDLTDAETNRRRAIPHVGTAYVQFTSGTVTFPASSGGNITCSPGTTVALTCASGNYAAVLIYLDGSGNLNALPGTDSAVLNTAITNLPPSPDETLPLGFVVVQNVAGTIQNITQANIAQFGTGAGGGSSGNVTSTEAALRDYNNFAGTRYLDMNIFRTAKATKVHVSSTGAFDLVKNAFKFTSVGQTFVSTNLANAEFLAEGVDITDAHLYLHWLTGFIDSSATYEVSRDGGTNWQSITMSRVGTASNAWRGYKVFTDEVTQQSLQAVAATGAGTALNATTAQQLSSQLTLTTTSVIRSIDLELNRATTGSTGYFYVSIVKNSGGVPSTSVADIVAESNAVSISALSTGNITTTVSIPATVLVAGTYHIVIRTDAAYKAATMDLSWRSGAGTNGAAYNGTSWTGSASTKAATVKGRAHDLRVRVTAGTGNTYLEGMGVYFPSDDGMVRPNGTKYVQRFYFSGDANQTQFTLNWTPDPDLLDILDPYRGQVYAVEYGVASISGNTVTFAPDTFNFPGESICLIFRQVKGSAIDNSDSNAAAISTINTDISDLGNQLSDLDFVTIPQISVPNTTIINRSTMPDLSQDMNARFAINRMQIQQIYRLQNEFGSNGEPVWGLVNDRLNQVRFVGAFSQVLNTQGVGVSTTNIGDYFEITFYGTGLNLLTFSFNSLRTSSITVDGVASGTFTQTLATGSTVLGGRNSSMNVVQPVVSGLSLGIHTVKLTLTAGALDIFGFEVLNENSSGLIKVNPGSQYVKGQKLTLSAQQSFAYNTTFETGTLGTKGGRVLVYQKSDGTIAKAVTPTDSSQGNISGSGNTTNHANEEVARVYNFREFGAGRADDFSSLTAAAASSRAFTLDDGTTTLVGQNVVVTASGPAEGVGPSAAGDFITITFVGTGLDVRNVRGASLTAVYTISIDGTAVATTVAGNTLFGSTGQGNLVKIVSGLPYGTHTVKIAMTTGGTGWTTDQFIVYQPKTPTLPVGAKAICAYNIAATFAANTTAGQDTIATGVIRKSNTREQVYVGTWTASLNLANIGGWQLTTTTTNDYVEYTFFGTGFEYRFSTPGTALNVTLSVDGTNPTAAGGTTSFYGAGITSFTAGTGVIAIAASAAVGNGARVSGLSLGLHKVRVTRTSGTGTMVLEAFDIITPIHSHKSNLYADLQNTLTIGSQAIEDQRKIKALEQITDQYASLYAVGVTSAPTTTSTSAVPLPDLSGTIYVPKDGNYEVSFSLNALNAGTSNSTQYFIYVDGVQVGPAFQTQQQGSSYVNDIHGSALVYLGAGTHKIDIYWASPSGTTATAQSTNRNMLVKRIL